MPLVTSCSDHHVVLVFCLPTRGGRRSGRRRVPAVDQDITVSRSKNQIDQQQHTEEKNIKPV